MSRLEEIAVREAAVSSPPWTRDAYNDFIAAAFDDVPFLLAEVERLRGVLRLHNQTPTGKVRKCLPGCIACALLAHQDFAE